MIREAVKASCRLLCSLRLLHNWQLAVQVSPPPPPWAIIARKPLISRVLTEMELVRELNEGIPRVFKEMKEAGLPEPKIVETAANVTVILYNEKAADGNSQTTENATEKTTEKIIRILKDRPYTTAGQLAEELGLTIDGVDYNIRKLKKQGRIVRIGGDKGGHWEVNEK